MMRRLAILIALALMGSSFSFHPRKAAADASGLPDFNPNNLIGDTDFTNTAAMSGDDVNGFLKSSGSWLADYVIPEYVNAPYYCLDGSGNYSLQNMSVHQVQGSGQSQVPLFGMRAADLLVSRAQRNGINPEVILVLLQRESSSITSSSPSSDLTRAWPLFYGFNESMYPPKYSCSDSANMQVYQSQVQSYGGLGQQLAYAPFGLMSKFSNAGSCPLNPVIDGQQMSLQSRGSAALYCYTPHIYQGNYNFWKFFTSWFGASQPGGYSPPLAKDASGSIYIADAGRLWHINSADAFSRFGFDWGAPVALAGSPYAAYPQAGDVGRLITTSWGRVFLMENGKKRPIMSARIFNLFGYNWSDITPLDDSLIAKIPTGIPLVELVRIQGTSSVYLQSRGTNYRLPDPDTFQTGWNFDWAEVADVPNYEVLQFPISSQTLSRLAVSNDGTVFLMDGGVKYRIPSAAIFNSYGFQWNTLSSVESSFLDRYPTAGVLGQLLGAPDGRIFQVSGGSKHYVGSAAFASRRFSFSDVQHVSFSVLNQVPNGPSL